VPDPPRFEQVKSADRSNEMRSEPEHLENNQARVRQRGGPQRRPEL